MMNHLGYHIITNPGAVPGNPSVHMVVEAETGRCLGGFGANYYRPWVFPFYTPAGLTVIQEFAYDHPFHNGIFVGQHPVLVNGRTANFWAMPPRRKRDDPIFAQVGRVDSEAAPAIQPHERGVLFRLRSVWRDENEEPVLDEVRTVDLYALEDATVCDVTSRKIAAYGDVHYPQTKFGSVGIRVEPRLLPAFGGLIRGDGDRHGKAAVVTEQASDFVAYENGLAVWDRYGVFLSLPGADKRGPWFIRDYGMAMHNPTWVQALDTPKGEAWTISLRVVAYDGELTAERANRWRAEPMHQAAEA